MAMDSLLERCLQELERTGDVEAVLARHPQYADELRPLLQLAMATRQGYAPVPKPPGGLVAGRGRFLQAARRKRREQAVVRQPKKGWWKLPRLARVAIALAMSLLLVAAAGGGAVMAADDSLPGEPLYGVKLLGEDINLVLSWGPQARIDLNLEFAGERVVEIQAAVENGEPVPEQAMTRMEQHLQMALEQASALPAEEQTQAMSRIAQQTMVQTRALERVQGMASPEARVGLSRAIAICQWGYDTAAAVVSVTRPPGTPPGQVLTPPGQTRIPPGQTRTPPGRTRTPPGQVLTPPDQELTPPGQVLTPPGQELTPPDQELTPPGQELTPPGQELTPPGQVLTPPGQGGSPPGQGGSPPGQDQDRTPPGQGKKH